MKRRDSIKFVLAILCCSFLTACMGNQPPVWKKPKDTAVYSIASKQRPLPPTYNPVRWVRPPEMLPEKKEVYRSGAPLIKPIVSFSVKNASLEEVSQVFANAIGYRSYCSSLIAKRTFTLEMIGTIDEIAANIEKNAGIKVAINHDTRDVRFLAGNSVVPKFAGR